MSIIHFVDNNIIFDINDVCFMRTIRKDETDEYNVEVQFKSGAKSLNVFTGTEEECNEKVSRIAESIETSSEPSQPQWLYGTYYEILYNLNNVQVIEIDSGVDPGGWHIMATSVHDLDSPYAVTYSDIHDVHEEMKIIAQSISDGVRVIRLQEKTYPKKNDEDHDVSTEPVESVTINYKNGSDTEEAQNVNTESVESGE